MKLLDAIRSVDRSPENTFGADPDEFIEALGLTFYVGWSKTFDERVKSHWLHRWMCTDTVVGHCAYYLDGEPVAYSYQQGRMCSLNLSFVSAEAAERMRNLILSLPELDQPGFHVVGQNDHIDEFQTVNYTAQVMDTYGYYEGQAVKVLRCRGNYADNTVGIVPVVMPDAEPITVPVRSVLFPLKGAVRVQLEGLE